MSKFTPELIELMNDYVIKSKMLAESKNKFYSAIDQEANKIAKFKVGDKLKNTITGKRLLVESIRGLHFGNESHFVVTYCGKRLTQSGEVDQRSTHDEMYEKMTLVKIG